jgi:hypothetical protein
VTEPATAATTTTWREPARRSPPSRTSSANRVPPIGALKEAPMPAAAPAATSARSRSSSTATAWPSSEPSDPPTSTIGPSRPPEAPNPSDSPVASVAASGTRPRKRLASSAMPSIVRTTPPPPASGPGRRRAGRRAVPRRSGPRAAARPGPSAPRRSAARTGRARQQPGEHAGADAGECAEHEHDRLDRAPADQPPAHVGEGPVESARTGPTLVRASAPDAVPAVPGGDRDRHRGTRGTSTCSPYTATGSGRGRRRQP